MDLALALNVISTIAIVSGVVFAGVQLRQARVQRAREAEMLLTRSFQTPEFNLAMFTVIELPDGVSDAQIDALGVSDIVNYWRGSMESLGILVHHREMSIELVEDFFSGPIVLSWRKLQKATEDSRKSTGRDTMNEWFQWLAERIQERETAKPPVPANIEYANWRH
jgi:hypothetical protein